MREQVALALVNKGGALSGQGKPEEAIAVYDAIYAHYGKDKAPGVREQVAGALFNKGITLGELGKPNDEIAVYDEVDGRYGKDEAPGGRDHVAGALMLINKGITLGGLGRPDEAMAAYDAINGRYGKDEAAGMREQVAKALNGLGYEQIMLAKRHWADEMRRIALLDEARLPLERALASCRSDLRAIVAGNIGYGHFLAGRLKEARRYTLECLQLDGQESLARQRLDAQLLRVDPEDRHYEQA
jgi:tetratricopeptide (TPR) repeat protein